MPELTPERRRELAEQYQRDLHAMQSGVAATIPLDGGGVSPKHLRVGLNARAADHCALVNLLIAAGVITEEQYLVAINEQMQRERETYERRLSEITGKTITLG